MIRPGLNDRPSAGHMQLPGEPALPGWQAHKDGARDTHDLKQKDCLSHADKENKSQ
jgi:hypothetical protein